MSGLTTKFWVDAYIRRLRVVDIPAFVVHHGNNSAGAVLVKLNTLDGKAKLFQRVYNPVTNMRHWDVLSEGEEADLGRAIEHQRNIDPDLWVVEVEDHHGRHLLDETGL